MRFENCNLHTSDFRKEIERFLSLTSRLRWEKIIKKIEAGSIFYRQYQYSRNPLLMPIINYFVLDKKGVSINQQRTPEILFLAEQSFFINRIIRNLNEKAKKNVLSRLSSDDTRSILFELSTAAHFLRNEFNVDFIEYERLKDHGKTFDLLVNDGISEGEVECKSKSYDSGRKIRRDSFYLLSDAICRKLKNKEISCLIDIKTKNALPSNQTILNDIAQNIASLIDSTDKGSLQGEEYSTELIPLQIKQPIDNVDSLENIVAPYKTEHCHFTSLSAANELWNVIIKIECESNDTIVSSIFEELKKAKSQFSRNLPGLLPIKIEGVHPEEWALLSSDSSLEIMTKHFFETENCPYIHTITYSSDPIYVNYGSIIDSNTKTLVYKNHLGTFLEKGDIFKLLKK